ncbi:N-acetyltransferase [Piscinibacter sp. XHJ-5]|uniref:GNAT family N-acetyltransferase n=1 Tax=Piscinibacter sp. XHJ-5 TaxID=3037797 RepID=UPI002452A6F6|nr:N-acetyltransferase [Piscinibacter sp. XHJ-5]
MHAEPLIRALEAADLAAYKALRDEMLELHPEAFTSDAPTERARSAAAYLPRLGLDRADGGQFTLGAWHGDTLVGALTCECDKRIKVRHIGHVVGMMVHPQARGRGIGSALLAACIARARSSSGMEMLTLTVTSSNRPAVALYEGAGFRRYGRLEHAIKLGDTYHDKDLMVLHF